MKKKILFLVASPFQLFNAIVLRMTERSECECDLLLRSAISWNEDVIKRIEDNKVFDKILRPEFTEAEKYFWEATDEEKAMIVEEPLRFYGQPPIEVLYDEIFTALDAVAWKLIYYYQVLCGKKPEIMQYDEGIRSYTLEFGLSDERTFYAGNYSTNKYSSAIKAIYLYRPELYTVQNYSYELRSINNPYANVAVRDVMAKVYGIEPIPQEKFIFFEDFFFADRHITNDMELFKEVVECVGKENLIVKTHPRDDFNRFALLDSKTMGASKTPWEAQLLNSDISDKVLISVSSTAIFTPYIIFGMDIAVVSLEKLFYWPVPLHKDKGFDKYFDLLYKSINKDRVRFYMPSTIDELREILLFLQSE